MIQLKNVHKAFGPKRVLQGFTLDVPEGETMVIIGYSGTGKSVAIKHIVGLLDPDQGEVWVDGQLPYKVGQYGGNVVAGFNAPNLVELPDPQPGKTYTIAVFAINGPISVSPANWLFLRDTRLEVWDRP